MTFSVISLVTSPDSLRCWDRSKELTTIWIELPHEADCVHYGRSRQREPHSGNIPIIKRNAQDSNELAMSSIVLERGSNIINQTKIVYIYFFFYWICCPPNFSSYPPLLHLLLACSHIVLFLFHVYVLYSLISDALRYTWYILYNTSGSYSCGSLANLESNVTHNYSLSVEFC